MSTESIKIQNVLPYLRHPYRRGRSGTPPAGRSACVRRRKRRNNSPCSSETGTECARPEKEGFCLLDVVRSAISELIPANHILNTVIKIDTTIKKTYLEVRGERLLHHHLRPLETHREDVPALSVKLFIRAGVRGRSGKSRDRRFLRRWGEADMGYPEMKMMNRNEDIKS